MRWPWQSPRIAECEGCETLRRDFKALGHDFEELQDKVYRWMQRTAQRERVAVEAAATESNGDEEPVETAALSRGGLTRAERIARLNRKRG